MDAETQNRLILDQFTRQAGPFARLPAHSTEESIRLVREAAGIGADDTILDVACGPGLLACAFARSARHVTGIDLTPAMIEQARSLQRAEGLANLSWHLGDVAALPFPAGSFSVAFTRYSFHHLLDPRRVLAEMVRVTEPGGRVVVVDVYTSGPDQAAAYDHVERLRDPSHVRALGSTNWMAYSATPACGKWRSPATGSTWAWRRCWPPRSRRRERPTRSGASSPPISAWTGSGSVPAGKAARSGSPSRRRSSWAGPGVEPEPAGIDRIDRRSRAGFRPPGRFT